MLCFVLSNLQALHPSEHNCWWEAPNMISVAPAQTILKQAGSLVIPLNTVEVESSCGRQCTLSTTPGILGVCYHIADSFYMWWNFIWILIICAGNFLGMGEVQLRVMLGVSTGWLQKPCSQTLYLTTFEHTPKSLYWFVQTSLNHPTPCGDPRAPNWHWESMEIELNYEKSNEPIIQTLSIFPCFLSCKSLWISHSNTKSGGPRIQLRAFWGQVLRHNPLCQPICIIQVMCSKFQKVLETCGSCTRALKHGRCRWIISCD